MTINPMNTYVTYGTDGNIYLTNIEDETVIDLISFPIADWTDKKALAAELRELGRAYGWY